MDYQGQQQSFTPYVVDASYRSYSDSQQQQHQHPAQSSSTSSAIPSASTSGPTPRNAAGSPNMSAYPYNGQINGGNAYHPSSHQPRLQQQLQDQRGYNLQSIAPMVPPRDSSSGPARQGSIGRRDYSVGGSNGNGNMANGVGGSGRSAGPYARPSEPAPLSAREGAGPGTVKASSTTSEFTKRKNWSQHIIDEIQDFMHVLAPDGTVMFAAPSIHDLTGWTPEDVTGRPISDFIHADDVESFLRDFDAALREGAELNVYYRFRMKDERYTIFEIAGHAYYAVDEATGERRCKCFFGMGRPYPSKNTAMLDSFLELKMENERLRQELQVMYRDIEGGATFSPYGQGRSPFPSPFSNPEALGNSPPQYDPRSGAGVIDPNTGLVQTSGLIPSSSNTYGALGIGISQTGVKGEGAPGDKKKKKPRMEEGDFVCRDCGTVDSPEWRKGPEGPKSLCNACGLRYAKLRSKDKLKGDGK